MARLIAYFDPERRGDERCTRGLEDAVQFHVRHASFPVKTETAAALDGAFAVTVVSRPQETDRLCHDHERGILVALDGGPQQIDRRIGAGDLARLFRELGPSRMADALDGGWTAVIVDEREKSVYLFRDRIGLKPFYHATTNGVLFASSNAGALVRAGWVSAVINENIVARYVTSNYRAVYGRQSSFFKEVSLLQPASYLHATDRSSRFVKYWDLDPAAPYLDLPEADMQQAYRDNLMDMITCFMRARRGEPAGVALSGGIDSGTISGLIHRASKRRVDAISLTYSEATEFDETRLIQCSVRDHVEHWHNIHPDEGTLMGDIPGLYDRFDIPLATISIYGYEYLYREAARLGMRTIFTGAGGDYIQAGNYTNYLYALASLKASNPARYEHELSCWIRLHGTAAFPKTPETAERFFDLYVDFGRRGQLKSNPILLMDGLLAPDFARRAGSLAAEVVPSYGDYLRSYIVQEYRYDAVAPGTEAEDMIDWIYDTSMTSPFFCKRVVEFGWSIPLEYKIKDGVNKVLARRALRGICSSEILDRVDKSGFNAPFDQWIRGGLRSFAVDVFDSSAFRSRGIYDQTAFRRILDDHLSGRANHMMLLWQALNLELWMLAWVDS